MKLLLALSIAALVFSSSLMVASEAASDTGTTQSYATLTVQSTPEAARVTIDGRLAGFSPCVIDSILPGMHILTLQHPDVESWLTEPVSDTVNCSPGEHRTLRFNLDRRYIITSSPFGAEVVLSDSIIGTTPMTATSDLSQQTLMFRKTGYESISVNPSVSGMTSVPLKNLWQNNGGDASLFKESDGTNKKHIGLYISGGATVISGVAAAYFKTRADNKYGEYLLSGNRKLLTDTHRLDTAAGIAIVITQIGLGLFTYFILSQ